MDALDSNTNVTSNVTYLRGAGEMSHDEVVRALFPGQAGQEGDFPVANSIESPSVPARAPIRYTRKVVPLNGSNPSVKQQLTTEMLVEFLMANPGKDCVKAAAKHFGYTTAYIHLMLKSDLFRARFRERMDQISMEATAKVRDKLLGLAEQIIGDLAPMLDGEKNPALLLAAFEKVFKVLGYGSNGVTINNQVEVGGQNFNVQANLLAVARERMRAAAGSASKENAQGTDQTATGGFALPGPSEPSPDGDVPPLPSRPVD